MLLSPFNEVVSYETYRLKDKRSVLYASEGGEIHRLKKRIGGLLPTLREFDGKKPIALLTFLSQLRVRTEIRNERRYPFTQFSTPVPE